MLLATPAAGAVPPPVADAGHLVEGRFFIESIAIEGLERASPQLLLRESMLEEGQVYSESDLRDAVRRIVRLPFILSAEFSLRRGTERGRYGLLVRVEEIRRFFFGENFVVTRFTNSVSFDSVFREWSVSPGGLVGVRFFLGDSNVLFLSAAGNRGLQAGWSRYGLFGGRGVLTLAVEGRNSGLVEVYPLGLDPTFSSWRAEEGGNNLSLTLGLPLGPRTGLRFEARALNDDLGERRNLLGEDQGPRPTLEYEDLRRFELGLAWTYDSTDDPVFPSEGLQLDLALDWQSLESELALDSDPLVFFPQVVFDPVFLDPLGDSELPPTESEQVRAAATVAQHWRLTPRLSMSLGARIALGRSRVEDLPVFSELVEGQTERLTLVTEDLDLVEGHFVVSGSFDLWGPTKTRQRGDLRLELGAAFGYDRTSPSLGLADNPLYRKSVSAALVFRNSWGLFRVNFQIADYGRGF